MIIKRPNLEVLRLAGYENVPPHYDDEYTLVEFIKREDLSGFPRFHIKKDKSLKWEIHRDLHAAHGRDIPGSVVAYGPVIAAELTRLKIVAIKRQIYLLAECKKTLEANYENILATSDSASTSS